MTSNQADKIGMVLADGREWWEQRHFTADELKRIDGRMMNYTVDFKYCGCKTSTKVHVGMIGNHYEVIEQMVKRHYGSCTEVLGARITGKPWKAVSPF